MSAKVKCAEVRLLSSSYLDGAVTGRQMHDIGEHLSKCGECAAEFGLLEHTHRMVSTLGRRKAPPELALQLRVAISQEAATARRRRLDSIVVQFENAINAFMVPATAGVVSAILIFGLLIGFFALPAQLAASNEDVPTMLYTPPELTSSPFGIQMGAVNADAVLVEAYVDANGRVQDYRIVSGPSDSELSPELKNMLIFTVFRPATAFGRPTAGRAVLSFSKINVKG
jgi:hypothetical protein